MITDAILDVLEALIMGVSALIPAFATPSFLSSSSIADAFAMVAGWLQPWAYWLDFQTAFTAAAFAITSRIGMFVYLSGAALLRLIRGSG